ncbi:hypothetical protein ANN_25079 [Periplaneta americana]|uniref:CGG triplet repeat-binding protein 1 n=1 Tax=Periplaneta americana TaxID=6978 RepID=A0ABQ8S0J5_PERAM|nr:hypothetical protein ANN_25079 [Periplaneta americana]
MPKVRHSVNLKSKLTSYISEFKEDGLSTDNKILFCNLCQCAVSSTQKFLVQQHITTSKHQANKQLNSKQRQLFLTQPTTSNVRSEFNIDLCRSLISADIPLYKLKNKVFREFLEKYTQHTIPDESTLRKTYAPSIYDETIQKIRDEIKDSSIWVSIDETPDKEGRLVGNVVIGLLSEQYSERILLHCDVLEKCNNKTIVKLFNEAMGILWPKGIINEIDDVKYFTYASLVSADVEHSSSAYKVILSDTRRSFSFETLKMNVVVYCSRNRNQANNMQENTYFQTVHIPATTGVAVRIDFSCAAQQLNASQSTHRFSFVNHTIKTVNMPKVRHSVNLKSKLTSYISEFKEDGLSTDNKILFCNLCQCAVSSTQKFLVQQHITTSKHQANKQLNSKQRQLFLTQPTTSNVRSEFNIDLCRSLISADIPLYKLKNKVFREFLEKYTQHTIPDESTLRKTYAPSIYDETIQKIRDEIKDSSIWVSIDETPDKEVHINPFPAYQ